MPAEDVRITPFFILVRGSTITDYNLGPNEGIQFWFDAVMKIKGSIGTGEIRKLIVNSFTPDNLAFLRQLKMYQSSPLPIIFASVVTLTNQPKISSNISSNTPSKSPSIVPINFPSLPPSLHPLYKPSIIPSSSPVELPSLFPSKSPENQPSIFPSIAPSISIFPTLAPSMILSPAPSLQPLNNPAISPSSINVPSLATFHLRSQRTHNLSRAPKSSGVLTETPSSDDPQIIVTTRGLLLTIILKKRASRYFDSIASRYISNTLWISLIKEGLNDDITPVFMFVQKELVTLQEDTQKVEIVVFFDLIVRVNKESNVDVSDIQNIIVNSFQPSKASLNQFMRFYSLSPSFFYEIRLSKVGWL
uniref:Uncharacterized protein n=1 Tax=Corethron hystrix TaxID=216773 RepID=A0A7S1FQH6_9STRA